MAAKVDYKLKTLVFFIVIGLLSQTALSAQEMTFHKKDGAFKSDGKVVADLEGEKINIMERNFLLKDLKGQLLMRYDLQRWNDTFGGATEYYYKVSAPAFGYEAYRENFLSLNNFKEIGEHILAEKLLNTDGSLNAEITKKYFSSLVQNSPDFIGNHNKINDSLMAQVNKEAPIVERDKRKSITANEYGKIGQGNTVIGYWELISKPKAGFNAGNSYMFLIRNINGGVICVSWIELSGAHTYVFKNGQRSVEKWTGVDLINQNPVADLNGQLNYATHLSNNLVRMGLL